MISKKVLVLGMILMATTVYAGSLFPPANSPSGNVPCPDGQVLAWTGDGTSCVDPTLGVTVECPENQVLTGIKKGVPVCSTKTPYTAGQYMTGAPGYCRYPNAITGSCSCPSGYRPARVFEYYNDQCKDLIYFDNGANPGCHIDLFVCYRN